MNRFAIAALLAAAVVAVLPVEGLGAAGGRVVGAGAGSGGATAASEEQDLEMVYQDALHKFEGEGDFEGAIEGFKRVVDEFDKVSALAAKAQLHIGEAYERLGKKDNAVVAYGQVTENFPASNEAVIAKKRLQNLGAAVAAPAEGQTADIKKKLEERLSFVDFNGVKIMDLVDFLRQASDVNIVVDGNLVNSLSPIYLALHDATVGDMLSLATRSLGLDWTVYKNAAFISDAHTIAEIKKETEAAKAAPADVDAEMLRRLAYESTRRAPAETAAAEEPLSEPVLKALAGVVMSKYEAAQTKYDRTKELVARRAVSATELPKVQTELAEATLAKTILDQGTDAQRRALLSSVLGGDAGQIIAVPSATAAPTETPQEVPPAPPETAAAEKPARKLGARQFTATLYVGGLPNFQGPGAVDLVTGETLPLPGDGSPDDAVAFLEEHPEFDIAVCRILGGGMYSRLGFVFNRGAKVAEVFEYTTVETLPEKIDYAEPLVVDDFPEEDKLPPGIGVQDVRNAHVLANSESFLWTSLQHFILETDRGLYIIRADKNSRNMERITYAPVPHLFGPVRRITLYDADTPGDHPQILNPETGKTLPAGGSMGTRAWMAEHPGFDVAYDGGGLVLFGNRLLSAVLAPKGLPVNRIGTVARSTKGISSFRESASSGVYTTTNERSGLGIVVIVPSDGPVFLETKDGGGYWLTVISKDKEKITFAIQAVSN